MSLLLSLMLATALYLIYGVSIITIGFLTMKEVRNENKAIFTGFDDFEINGLMGKVLFLLKISCTFCLNRL